MKGRIIGVKAQMSEFKLLFGLHLSERILKITDNLSKALQNVSVSAADAQIMAAKSVETLKRIRSDEMFELFWKHAESLRVNTDTKEPAPPRKRKAPLRYEVGGGDSFHFDSVEDHYRQI